MYPLHQMSSFSAELCLYCIILSHRFASAPSFNGNLNGWDVSSVEDMGSM